jgi:hypothetical protein
MRILALLALLISACAPVLPPGRGEAVLYRDLERIVGFRTTAGWEVDRLEIQEALADALLSVCASEPATRTALLAWIDARLAALGGPVERAFRERGRDLARVDELLALTRLRGLLVAAVDAAPADCPFWIEPRKGFAGRQIVDDRWQLELAGGGKGIVSAAPGSDVLDVTGGGAGRLAVWRHVGPRWSFGLAAELGASADFVRDSNGQRSSLYFSFDAVAPLLVRYRRISSFVELEAGPLAHGAEGRSRVDPGLHLGLAFGGRALRQGWFVPGAAFAVSYEQTFPGGDATPVRLVKLGLRVSLDFDL